VTLARCAPGPPAPDARRSGWHHAAGQSVRARGNQEGKTINGRRLNEDTYTVQIIDEQERLVSLTKADLREFAVLKTTPMPSYKDKFSAQELATWKPTFFPEV